MRQMQMARCLASIAHAPNITTAIPGMGIDLTSSGIKASTNSTAAPASATGHFQASALLGAPSGSETQHGMLYSNCNLLLSLLEMSPR
ncbi:uncharacterized protein BO95DRAFT_464661 [Aspergillus brunneoviolaceus CBS 621.78]|uniref:Uncharacterized protein n=1 Tax=Aspergillus brunneoviolaceus CBS 621.78 TaxID=1450534 RepID=A0ACD1G5W8_9EURO|nr:hypothetical protein BO95DRAFT_464661 [Aspergillus brunneoviolaceus CBS 621.78]RAH44666.1 hypothetical protein BO95DRAFT_464661 [Aspergillus brunneoviolaceus CBS 621.78]